MIESQFQHRNFKKTDKYGTKNFITEQLQSLHLHDSCIHKEDFFHFFIVR